MKTWQTEISPYLKRLNLILADISEPPPHPVNIPFGALETMPSALQCIIHRVSTFYEWGAWSRTRESILTRSPVKHRQEFNWCQLIGVKA